MVAAMRRTLLVSAGVLALSLARPQGARADVHDDVFVASLSFDQGFVGTTQLRGPGEPRANGRPTLAGTLRLELLFAGHLALGAEGGWRSWRPGGGTFVDDVRFPLADASGFLRVRFPLDDGTAEYYVLVGGGPSWLLHGDGDAYGPGVTGDAALGWSIFARAGVRAELVPGFGALLELGWVRRQHDAAFDVTPQADRTHRADAEGSYDLVANQVSVVIGWFVSF